MAPSLERIASHNDRGLAPTSLESFTVEYAWTVTPGPSHSAVNASKRFVVSFVLSSGVVNLHRGKARTTATGKPSWQRTPPPCGLVLLTCIGEVDGWPGSLQPRKGDVANQTLLRAHAAVQNERDGARFALRRARQLQTLHYRYITRRDILLYIFTRLCL